MERFLRYVSAHKAAVIFVAVGLAAGVAYISYVTRMQVDISQLYFVSIGAIAWVCGRRTSTLAAVGAAALRTVCDTLHGMGTPLDVAITSLLTLGSFLAAAHVVRLVSEMFDELGHLARHDQLTQVPNAAHFQRQLAVEFRRSQRYARPLTLAFIDVDDFKLVNDSHGHSAGDEVLRSIAAAVRGEVRSSDLLGRLGGDEFGLLLPETGLDEARPLLERVESRISNLAASRGWPVSISVGATAMPVRIAAGCTEQDLLHHADELMYRAKREGKGRVVADWFSADCSALLTQESA